MRDTKKEWKTMDNQMEIIVDFYRNLQRLGPGSEEMTKKALSFVELSSNNLQIADMGCGTGIQTQVLAIETGAEVVAVDFLNDFLESLWQRFNNAGLQVKTVCADIGKLPFQEQEFDVIWSEGAVYNIGFNTGTRYWNRFLKKNGFLAVTEISWLTNERPAALENYWTKAYAEIGTVENKIQQLKNNGYELITHFTLPTACWIENYYKPMQEQFDSFLEKWNYSPEACELVNESKAEIELYEKYYEYYGYEFYIVKKIEHII